MAQDDIPLDTPVAKSKEFRDSDGDGVSDVQESLEGTNPEDGADHLRVDERLRPGGDGDPRGDVDLVNLDRETMFDPSSTLPEGHTIDGGLTGLTNLDGTALRTGPSRVGLPNQGPGAGHDVDAALVVQRDPLAATGDAQPSTGGTVTVAGSGTSKSAGVGGNMHHDGPPPGVGASGSANPSHDMGLVSGEKEDADFVAAVNATQAAAETLITHFAQVTADADASASSPGDQAAGATLLTHVDGLAADQAALDKAFAAMKEAEAAKNAADAAEKEGDEEEEEEEEEEEGDDYSDPEAVTAAPTVEEIELAVVRAGGATTPVQTDIAGPSIAGDAPPPLKRDLVTDGGDEIDGITGQGGSVPLLGAPDAPVINVINPDSGFIPPTPGEEGGGGQTVREGSFGAATAATGEDAQSASAGEVRLAGSGGGSGIASLAAGPEDDGLGIDPGATATEPFEGSPLDHAAAVAPEAEMTASSFGGGVDDVLGVVGVAPGAFQTLDIDGVKFAGEPIASVDVLEPIDAFPMNVEGDGRLLDVEGGGDALLEPDGRYEPLDRADDDTADEPIAFGGPLDDGFD
jgi:hypothetical protein